MLFDLDTLEDATEQDMFVVGIFKLCERLHMSVHGSSDMLTDEIRDAYARYLATRLENWKESPPHTQSYDACVRSLIETTLQELLEVSDGQV